MRVHARYILFYMYNILSCIFHQASGSSSQLAFFIVGLFAEF